MKNLKWIGLAFALVLLSSAMASAQRGPIGPPWTCDCDTCYANPILECSAGTHGTGSCSLYYYLFCYPWHVPGSNMTTTPTELEKAHPWRAQSVADFLIATAPGAQTNASALAAN